MLYRHVALAGIEHTSAPDRTSTRTRKSEKDIYDTWAMDSALKRGGQPEEVADTSVWLTSARASFITGKTILVGGGSYKGL